MFQLKITGLVEAHFFAPQMTKMIGIVDPNTNVPPLPIPYHVEKCHDIMADEMSLDLTIQYKVPSRENLERILEFSKTFEDDDRVLIHCHAGISRSTATAIAVLIQHGMSVPDAYDHAFSIRPHMNPNTLIIGFADDLLGCNGELVAYHRYWLEEKQIQPESFAGQNVANTEIDAMKALLAKLNF